MMPEMEVLRRREAELQQELDRLSAEVAQQRAECEDCALIAELSRERDVVVRRAEKLAELEQFKSDLFADISHEFRTPLTLVIGPLRDLADGNHGPLPAEARRQVELASRNAERLLGLVEQVLDTAKLDAGKMELRVRRGDLVGLLVGLIERFEPLAERCRARLSFEPPGEPIPIWCDPGQLEKVFSNLLSNALRYSPRGGVVEIAVEPPPAADRVAVTVRDQGPGIAPEDRERIFDRFYRVPKALAEGQAGTGLGLPLARRLAELHGGSVALESGPGQGSVFRVELPLGRDHFAPSQLVDGPPAAASPAERRPGRRRPDPGPDRGRPGPSLGERRPFADPEDRTTVLVVDDHPGVRSFVRHHLEQRYRVEEAGDGAEALALARELLPDLVVSDLMMPEMDGHALCRVLKQDPELDYVPVVLLTARAGADDKLLGLVEGADEYLTKPFDVRELVARVDNLIGSRRRLRERLAGGGPLPPLRLAPGARTTADDREWLGRVREAIEAGLGGGAYSVAALAGALAVSRSQLFKRLRRLTGRSPSELIATARLERAASLLRAGTGSVSDVAYDAGYQSVAHFSRRFRERFGRPPSAWRRRPRG